MYYYFKKIPYHKYLFIIKSMSLNTFTCVILGVLNVFVRTKLLLTAPDFHFFFILVQIYHFKLIIVSSLYLRTVYMDGHMELDTDEICRCLKRFVRPTFLFVSQKDKLAKGNQNCEKSHSGSVPMFWYYGNP